MVIVIDGGAHWTYLARRALYRASCIWGGAGFAVVPHHGGKVHSALLRACRIYDPDYVLNYRVPVGDLEHFSPGSVRFTGPDGDLLEGEARQEMLDQVLEGLVDMPGDRAARAEIAAVCSPYQSAEPTERAEFLDVLEEDDTGNFTLASVVPDALAGSVLACPATWGGLLGTAIASHAGVAAPPERTCDEPEVSDDDRLHLGAWLLGADWASPPDSVVSHAGAATGVNTRATPTANDQTATFLQTLASGPQYKRTGLLVCGDSADDFALARLWALNFGDGYWMPSALGIGQSTMSWTISAAVDDLQHRLSRRSGQLAIASTSLPTIDVQNLRDRMASDKTVSRVPQSGEVVVTPIEDLPWGQHAVLGFAIQDQWASITTIPVSVDSTSTVSMAAPLPPPVLTNPRLASLPDVTWHVDVDWTPGNAVRGRGTDSLDLFAERPSTMLTWARSSREGITYQAQRFDFISAGTRLENTLARVALRDLSLETWTLAKAREHNHDARPSDAGRRAALLAKMLGGRQAYTDLFGGPLLPALQAMLPTNASTSKAYPNNQGVVLAIREGVLSFTGLGARCLELSNEELRERVDDACRAGVLRRGLVLRCAICEDKQFLSIDKLGQRWSCLRCDALNDLDHWSWKAPPDEPTWFYDLHPVGRQVLRDNGHVPALLSSHLQRRPRIPSKRQPFSDVGEVVFSKNGQEVVELDLITYVNDTITVAECKSSGSTLEGRTGRREVTKKCQAAAWLRADELLFATTDDNWADTSKDVIKSAVESFPGWGPLGPPSITLVSQLGTDHEKSEALRVAITSAHEPPASASLSGRGGRPS
ncbi:hypothetical protein [Lentzea sp. CA-135723]|uniref:hypothetical protein n=1 Tax=Lentzea sp. CA-135723 TaxID=3239950 RepID=UPI003D9323E0